MALEPAEVDDAALVEAIAAWERLVSWATARQAHAVNELRRRREGQRREAFVGDEIAARLGTTRAGGESKVLTASSLERLPEVSDALERGDIDHLKARVICDEVLPLDDAEAHRVVAAVLPRASVLTGPQLRSRIRRMELAQNPAAAEERHRAAVADRFVDLQPARDGMAWLNAYLPADQGVAVYTTLTALADAAAPDDPRPIAARRADALVDLVTPYLDAGVGPDGRALPVRQRRRPHLQVTASATTLLGLTTSPASSPAMDPSPRRWPGRSPPAPRGGRYWSTSGPASPGAGRSATGRRRTSWLGWWTATGPAPSRAAGFRRHAATSTTSSRSTRPDHRTSRPGHRTCRHSADITTC